MARLAAVVGLLAVLATGLGPVLARTGLATPYVAFPIFFLGIGPGMLLALVLGGIGLLRTRGASGRSGRPQAWVGVAAGGALLLLVLSFRPWSLWVTLHGATTSIEDPPLFSDAVRARRTERGAALGLPRVNTTDYPSPSPDHPPPISGDEVIAFQRAYYPDLAPIALPEIGAGEALETAHTVARELGWNVTAIDREAGRLEAFDSTPFFGFEDDVVVRVRPDPNGGGSIVDMRSTSLYRANDLRQNAERIREFTGLLRERIAAASGGE